MKRLILIAISLVFVVAGSAVLYFALGISDKAGASEDWPTVTGTIISSEIDRSRNNDSETTYKAQITYEYAVGQDQIVGNRIRFVNSSTSDSAHASRDVNRYPEGKTVTIYYNPEDHYESVLEPGQNAAVWNVIILGLMFVLVGSLSLLIGIFNKSRHIKVTTKISSTNDQSG